MGLISSYRDYDMLTKQYWYFQKASDKSCRRQSLRVAILFNVSFHPLSLIICSMPPLWIVLLKHWWGRFLKSNEGSSWWSYCLHHFPVSPSFDFVSMYVLYSFLELRWWFVSSNVFTLHIIGQYYKMILIPTIVSYVLVSCTPIFAVVQPAIPLIYSALAPENTWTEATYAWVWVVNLGGLRLSCFVFYKAFPDEVSGGKRKGIPCFHQDWVHVGRSYFSTQDIFASL